MHHPLLRSTPALREVADEVDGALRTQCEQVVALVAPGAGRALARTWAEELHALTEGLAFALVTWPERRSRSSTRDALARTLDDLARRTS